MSSEALANIIEGHYAAHLHCHVLIDPLAIAGRSDHALLAQLREALGEAALTRVHRADLAHVPHLHPVLVCLASPGAMPSRTLLELTARTAQRGLHQRRRYLSGWLFSEAAPVTLAAHVSALCRIPNAERAFSFLSGLRTCSPGIACSNVRTGRARPVVAGQQLAVPEQWRQIVEPERAKRAAPSFAGACPAHPG